MSTVSPSSGGSQPIYGEPTRPVRTRGPLMELTIRGIIIGGLITLVFTAANIYLGLKVGLTFATSIPAAVISMAVLKAFRNHTIQENNIVQTIASAAGTLSAIIFVLPGLIILGSWADFPYWQTAAVTCLGGILGVMYSIPLRRAMVTGSDLPYPEGVAAAEVLKVGDSSSGAAENRRGLMVIIISALAAAFWMLITTMKLVGATLMKYFKVGKGATSFTAGWSLALIGVGHLVGLTVGIAMLIGLIIGFGFLLVWRTWGDIPGGVGMTDLIDITDTIWVSEVRLIGAGVMAVAALWTLAKVIWPIIKGIREALASNKSRAAGEEVPITEQDLSMKVVGGTILASMLPIGLLLWLFFKDTGLTDNPAGLIVVSLVYILVIGLAVAAVCGYMAGLIGASNSPISGVGILIVITAALLIKAVYGAGNGEGETAKLVAYTLFTAAVVFGVATISNDNLQDLKTGQLVDATPWKQQVALVIGVVFGSLVIPPVLNVLNKSVGFAGAPGHEGDKDALPAPQANLLATLAKGVLGGNLDWGLLGIGVAIGVAVIIVDELMGVSSKGRFHLPPLAVGMGIYLPMSLTIVIPLGAVLGTFYDKWATTRRDPERAKRLGVLMATGLIVGESLFGVFNAFLIYASDSEWIPFALKDPSNPLSVFSPDAEWPAGDAAMWIGSAVFIALTVGLYLWIKGVAAKADRNPGPGLEGNLEERPAVR